MTERPGFTPGLPIQLQHSDGEISKGRFVGWLPNGVVWREDQHNLIFTPTHDIRWVRWDESMRDD